MLVFIFWNGISFSMHVTEMGDPVVYQQAHEIRSLEPKRLSLFVSDPPHTISFPSLVHMCTVHGSEHCLQWTLSQTCFVQERRLDSLSH